MGHWVYVYGLCAVLYCIEWVYSSKASICNFEKSFEAKEREEKVEVESGLVGKIGIRDTLTSYF